MHLGMSGSFRVHRRRRRRRRRAIFHHERRSYGAHDHVVFRMSTGATVDVQRSAPLRLHEARAARRAIDEEPLLRALGPEPLGNEFDAAMLAQPARARRPASRRRCSTSASSPGSATSMSARRCSRARLSPQAARPSTLATAIGRAARARRARWSTRSRRCSPTRSRPAARRCATIAAPTASSATSSTASASTTARASRARRAAAAAPSGASCRPAARPSSVRSARDRLIAAGEGASQRSMRRHDLREHPRRDQGRVGIIRLNRPQALNALNAALIDELNAAIDAFEADAEHRLHPHHRLGQGVRRRRRHQGDGGQVATSTSTSATSPATGTASRVRASR